MKTMPKTIRLNDQEQEQIRQKCVEINKLLIKEGREPLKDSELVHEILRKSIAYVKIRPGGSIEIELP